MKAWGRFAVAGSERNDEWWHSSKLQIAVSVSLHSAPSRFTGTRLFPFLLKIACACQAFYIRGKMGDGRQRSREGGGGGGGAGSALGGGGGRRGGGGGAAWLPSTSRPWTDSAPFQHPWPLPPSPIRLNACRLLLRLFSPCTRGSLRLLSARVRAHKNLFRVPPVHQTCSAHQSPHYCQGFISREGNLTWSDGPRRCRGMCAEQVWARVPVCHVEMPPWLRGALSVGVSEHLVHDKSFCDFTL